MCVVCLNLNTIRRDKVWIENSGKVQAYDGFVSWYAGMQKDGMGDAVAASFQGVANPMLVWGSRAVARQVRLLHQALQADAPDADDVKKKADGLYLVVLRDIGHSASGDRSLLT